MPGNRVSLLPVAASGSQCSGREERPSRGPAELAGCPVGPSGPCRAGAPSVCSLMWCACVCVCVCVCV